MIIHLHFKTKKAAIDIATQLCERNKELTLYIYSYSTNSIWICEMESDVVSVTNIGICNKDGFVPFSKVKEENSAIVA